MNPIKQIWKEFKKKVSYIFAKLYPEEKPKNFSINSLVFPLRHDILLREQFISFYLKNKELYKKDFDSFFKKSYNHMFFKYYKLVKIATYEPKILKDEKLLIQKYKKYIICFISLFEDIKKNGFNKEYPIRIETGKNILPTETGKIFSKKYYMGDGCHRLACLKFLGFTDIPSDFVNIRKYYNYSPLDVTSIMAERGIKL